MVKKPTSKTVVRVKEPTHVFVLVAADKYPLLARLEGSSIINISHQGKTARIRSCSENNQ